MLKTVFSIQVATGAEVIVIALHTLPADACDPLLRASITYNIGVLDICRKTHYNSHLVSVCLKSATTTGGVTPIDSIVMAASAGQNFDQLFFGV